MNHFGDYQNEIYLQGLHGIRSSLPVDFKRLEERASAAMSLLMAVDGLPDIAALRAAGVRRARPD